MERATVEALTAPRVKAKTAELEIDGVGTVVVRGLSRWEMIHLQKLADNRHKQDAAALAIAMVEPTLTDDEATAWQRAGGWAEIEAIAQKINELSGIGKGAAKSDLSGDGERGA